MPITGYYDEAQQENDRLQRQAQLNQALQAFSGFIQKNRESKQSAPLIQAQTMSAQAEALMNQMKAQQAQQFLMKKYGQQGDVQLPMQQPQMGGMGRPSLTMPSPSGGAPKFLSPQQLMAQNQMSGGFQGGQQPQVDPQSANAQKQYSIQDIIEPERDPFTNELTGLGLQQQAQNDLIKKELEAEQKTKVPTAKMREDLRTVDNQISMLDEMEKSAQDIPGGWEGILNSAVGIASRGKDVFGLNKVDETRLYNSNKPALAVSIYRALTGDTRLSDADAKARALPLLWDTSEDDVIKASKFKFLKNALMNRKKLISSGQYSQDDSGNFITPIDSVLGGAAKDSGAVMMEDANGNKAWVDPQTNSVIQEI